MSLDKLLADQPLARAMTEDELLTAITEAMTLYGWRWHHVRRSDKAVQQGHNGFPDIVAARKGRVLFLELKAGKGRLTEDQIEWLNEVTLDLWEHSGHPWPTCSEGRAVWPQDLDSILAMLR